MPLRMDFSIKFHTQVACNVARPWPVLLVQGVAAGMQLSVESYSSVSVLPDEQLPFGGSMSNAVNTTEAADAIRDYVRSGGKFVTRGLPMPQASAYSFGNFTRDLKKIAKTGRQVYNELEPFIKPALQHYK